MGIYLKGLDLFPALVRREGGLYQVEFFDIPDCRAHGATTREAEHNAGEALRAHIEAIIGRRLASERVKQALEAGFLGEISLQHLDPRHRFHRQDIEGHDPPEPRLPTRLIVRASTQPG